MAAIGPLDTADRFIPPCSPRRDLSRTSTLSSACRQPLGAGTRPRSRPRSRSSASRSLTRCPASSTRSATGSVSLKGNVLKGRKDRVKRASQLVKLPVEPSGLGCARAGSARPASSTPLNRPRSIEICRPKMNPPERICFRVSPPGTRRGEKQIPSFTSTKSAEHSSSWMSTFAADLALHPGREQPGSVVWTSHGSSPVGAAPFPPT